MRAWAIMVPHPFLPSPQRAWPLTSMSPQPTCPLPGPSMSPRWWPGEAPYCPRMCLSPRWQHQVWASAPIGRWGTLRLEEGPGSGVPGAAGSGGGEEALRELQHGSQAPRVGTRGEKVPRSQSLVPDSRSFSHRQCPRRKKPTCGWLRQRSPRSWRSAWAGRRSGGRGRRRCAHWCHPRSFTSPPWALPPPPVRSLGCHSCPDRSAWWLQAPGALGSPADLEPGPWSPTPSAQSPAPQPLWPGRRATGRVWGPFTPAPT